MMKWVCLIFGNIFVLCGLAIFGILFMAFIDWAIEKQPVILLGLTGVGFLFGGIQLLKKSPCFKIRSRKDEV